MTRLRTASELASLALERVGVYAAVDAAADHDQLSRALSRLDLLVAELTGTMRCLWLVKKLAIVPLTAGVGDFDLIQQSAGAIKPGDVQFVMDVKLRSGAAGDDRDILQVDQRGWDDIPSKIAGSSSDAGPPETIFIDRTPRLPHVYISPVPNVAGTSLVLALQSYAPDLTLKDGNVQVGMEVAWHRWAEYATAADIGSGPVVNLPMGRIQDYRKQADMALNRLVAFNAQSGIYPDATRFRDF
jgi:hypothetical protein